MFTSLGVMLFEMATGRRPFENETPYSIAVMQVTQQPPMPRKLNPMISTALEVVILKSLKKSRDDRYQNSVGLAESLKLAIERPTAVHDTEPRLKMASYQDILADEPTKPPEKPKNQAPPPGTASRPVVPPPRSLRSQIRKRRSQSPVISALIGGSIGCGLLGIIVAGIFLTFSFLLPNNATPTETQESDVDISASSVATEFTRAPDTITNGSAIPTLDATNEAARATLLARASEDSPVATAADVTPLFPDNQVEIRPVGELGTPELSGILRNVSGTIIFADERGDDPTFEVVSINFDNWIETQLTQSPFADNMYPIASPNGQRIAFQSDREDNFEIYIVNRGGGALERMTFNTVTDRLAAWSSDGEWIIYSFGS